MGTRGAGEDGCGWAKTVGVRESRVRWLQDLDPRKDFLMELDWKAGKASGWRLQTRQ